MATGVLTTPEEFSAYMGGTGIYTSDKVLTALMLAESKVGEWLSTPLIPQQYSEEFDWPLDEGKIMLKKVRIISVDELLGYYWIDHTVCAWQTAPLPCAIIYDYDMSIVRIIDGANNVSVCCGSFRACPIRIKITYTAGLPAEMTDYETLPGRLIRGAVFNAALGFLQTSIGLNATGDIFIPSFSIAGYSESRQLPERSGAEDLINQHIQNAKNMLRGLTIRRPIQLRRRKRVLPL